MSNVYCVSYDLKEDGGNYTDLYDVLKSSMHWWHYLESTWLVVIDGTAADLWEKLQPHLNTGDRLLIVAVNGQSQGWLPEKAWDWIHRNVDTPSEQFEQRLEQLKKDNANT